jgi:hypothetical protein
VTAETRSWRVRIEDETGRPTGAGVLVDDHHVLTCAHVVARAPAPEPPRRPVTITFPAVTDRSLGLARVAPDGWFPMTEHADVDLAVLTVDEPPAGVEPAVLGLARAAVGHRVTMYGHPSHYSDGVWVRGEIAGAGGPGGAWYQIGVASTTGRPIEPGFSGAGIVDEDNGSVIGLAVARDIRTSPLVTWLLPWETAAGYWPPLASLVSTPGTGRAPQPTPAAGRPPSQLLSQLVDALLDVPAIADSSSRELIVSMLPPEIAAATPRQRAGLADVRAIVQTCLQYPGGLRDLVNAVDAFGGRGVAAQRLAAAVDEYEAATFGNPPAGP